MAASGRIKGITIELNGDSTGLTKALSSVDNALKNTQTNLRDIDKALKLDPGNVDLLKDKQSELSREIEKTKEKLDIEKQALEQMKGQDGFDETSQKARDLQTQIDLDTAALKELENQSKDFGSVFKQQMQIAMDKVKEVGESIKEVGQKMSDVGKGLTTTVTAPIVGGFAAAIKTAGDFDQSMSKVEAISGATAEEMENLRTTAMDMAEQTKFTASEMADALSYMAMAGWDSQQMMDGLSGVTYLAAASGEDLAMVSDIVTDGLTAFGLSAEDSAHFADVLAKTAASANTNVSMMGESFKYVGPVAGSMGYSIEDMSLALGLMANNGIKADQAGTALRNLIQRMAKPTKESETAINMLGLSLDDGEGNMLSFKEVLDQLRNSFGDLMMPEEEFLEAQERLNQSLDDGMISEDEYESAMDTLIEQTYGAEAAEKARYAAMLAGARAMPALLAMVNTSEEDYKKLTASIEDSTGAAEKMSDIMMDNLPGQMDVVKSKLEKLAITFGEDLMPIVEKVVDGIQGFLDKLNSLDEGQRQQIMTIAAIVAAVGPALLIIGKIITGIGSLITAVGTIGSAIAAVTPVIAGIGATITGTVLPAIAAVVAPILPIIAAVAAVTAAIVLLWQNWDQVSAWISETWEKLTGALAAGWEAIKEGIGALGSFVSDKWNAMKEGIGNAVSNIKENAVNGFNNLKENVGNAMTNLKENVSSKWDTIKQKTGTAVQNMKTNAQNTFTNMKNSIATTIGNIKNTIVEGFQNAVNYITSLPGQALNWGKDIIANIVNGIKSKIDDVKNAAGEVANAIKSFLGFSEPEEGPLSNFHTYMPDMIDLMTKGIKQGIPEVESALNDLASSMIPTLQGGQGQTTNNNTTNTVSINVYGSAGQNVNELADIIERRITDNVVRRGAAFA